MSEENKKFKETVQLNDEQMEQVSGGRTDVTTQMCCNACDGSAIWAGHFGGKGPYECPYCHEIAFYGYNEH